MVILSQESAVQVVKIDDSVKDDKPAIQVNSDLVLHFRSDSGRPPYS